MSISKTKHYMVLNHSASPVCVSTRYDSYLIQGGTQEDPGSMPLTFDEISVINSVSPAFKIGLLRFEPDCEKEMYEALAIANWQDILTLERIEEILLHPTMETMEQIIQIDNVAYFERVRGVFVGLKNAGANLSVQVENVINQRYAEFVKRQRKTSIKLVADEPTAPAPSKEEFDEMKAQLAAMKAMMEQMAASSGDAKTTAKADAEVKPAAKSTTNKSKSARK